ncbi:MAG TPA: hypothetical protein VGR27_03180 [Longimicrobiaceae bacterium]|nr:hypothetical protein [Longimicrobiaceae bacterium]
MNSFLFHAHSGIRYLVLLAGAMAVLFFAAAWITRRPPDRAARVVMAVFAGVLDLQVLLGIVLVITGIFYPALIGHIVMMLLAVVFAHGFSIASRRSSSPRRSSGLALGGVLLAMGAIISGILAIGRAVI